MNKLSSAKGNSTTKRHQFVLSSNRLKEQEKELQSHFQKSKNDLEFQNSKFSNDEVS